jgi:hypothetical protein
MQALDDEAEVRVQQRLPARQADGNRAQFLPGLIDHPKNEIGIQRTHRSDVVADAVGAPEIAVLGQGEAEDDQ